MNICCTLPLLLLCVCSYTLTGVFNRGLSGNRLFWGSLVDFKRFLFFTSIGVVIFVFSLLPLYSK